MDRHSGGGVPPHLRGRPVSGLEAAHASEYFEPFLNATTLKNILGYHRSMCELLHLKPNVFLHFYPKLRANLTSWRAKALWKKFDARASHKCYGKGKACAGTRVLVIGAGPCGLRTAIEAQLLGAKVVVIEKRDRLSRNNVLHLWPFVIEDLRMLGAKKFFGKFCAGSIDHISIRQIQCILLKVALLLGVEVHTEVSFEKLIEPNATEKTGWRAEFAPENHPVSQYEFDVIIGADGKRNTLQGFKRKEFRGKLAIAITANFINKKTEAEARVEEISGVAFIFNQKFFKDLQEETRIDLENIVYYKDDTHYFVMTAKKASLLEKGVIKQDLADTEKLLAPENVDRDALQNYAREAADFSTNYQLPNLQFAVNHYGQPDVAMFDFTSMYAAEYASKVVERNGHRLLMILVGDSLLEPFWPTGSGCARGFLSSLDAAWAIRSWCSGQMTPLDVLAERESIYRLLAQTTPDNLNKDWKAYTLDPATRYPNLNKSVVTSHQTVCLYDTDNADNIDRMKRASLDVISRQDHVPKKRRRGNVDNEVLLSWLKEQLRNHEEIAITDMASVFRDGKPLCAIIHHYRPDLLDYGAIKDNEPAKCNQLAMDILEKELGIPPFMTGAEITITEDYLALATYLTQVYDTFRGEIPHIKHPKLENISTPSKIPQKIRNPSKKNSKNPLYLEKLNIYGDQANLAAEKPRNHAKSDNSLRNDAATTTKKRYPKKHTSVLFSGKKTLSEQSIRKKLNLSNRESKMDIFDHTYAEPKSIIKNNEAKKIKKTKSRNVAVLAKMPESRKKKIVKVKKSKLSVIPENLEEKAIDKTPKKDEIVKKKSDLNRASFRCETFVHHIFPELEADEFKSPSVQIFRCATLYQNLFKSLEPTKTLTPKRHCSRHRNVKSLLGLKHSSPLQIIRDHILKKKSQIRSVLSKPNVTKPVEQPQITSPRSSNQSITIQVIQRSSNEKITCQSVEYRSSLNLVKITSKSCMAKKFIKDNGSGDFAVPTPKEMTVQQLFKNRREKFSNPSGSHFGKMITSRSRPLERGLSNTKKSGKSIPEKPKLPILLTPLDVKIIKALGKKLTAKKSCQNKRQKFSSSLLKSVSSKCQLNGTSKKAVASPVEISKVKSAVQELRTNRLGKLEMELFSEDPSISPRAYFRVQNWISQHDFKSDLVKKDPEKETLLSCDMTSDITSITRVQKKGRGEYDDVKVEERTDVIKCESPVLSSQEDIVELVKTLKEAKPVEAKNNSKSVTRYNMKSTSAPPGNFSVIVEGEESELPESNKRSEFSFKSIKTMNHPVPVSNVQNSRPSSRHKRHAEVMVPKPSSIDRKPRKRRTLERIGPSVIYSHWLRSLVETVLVGISLLCFDMYFFPEEYADPPSSYWEYFWT